MIRVFLLHTSIIKKVQQSKMENLRLHCVKYARIRSSPSEVFLGKGVLKICSKVTGETTPKCDFNKFVYTERK